MELHTIFLDTKRAVPISTSMRKHDSNPAKKLNHKVQYCILYADSNRKQYRNIKTVGFNYFRERFLPWSKTRIILCRCSMFLSRKNPMNKAARQLYPGFPMIFHNIICTRNNTWGWPC